MSMTRKLNDNFAIVGPMLVAAILFMSAPFTAFADDDKAKSDSQDQRFSYVRMTTSKGEIYLKLDRTKAPITVANFVRYVEDEFYDGTIFHRVIESFMIQGGGFTSEMQQKPTRRPIENEWQNGLKNVRGTIAMARTADPDSATAQFFINVQDNPRLDEPISGGAGYAVFGSVVHGMDVVDVIRKVETGRRGPHGDVPIEPILIKRVRLVTHAEVEAERAKDDDTSGNRQKDQSGADENPG